MSKIINKAAYLPAVGAPLEVREAPYTQPGPHEVLIKAHAVAINPVDSVIQKQGPLITPWLKYPFILGTDVAGEVVQVGAQVKSLHIGDRVLGHAVGFEKAFNTPTQGAFQEYVILQEHMTSAIPASMPFQDASVIPLGLFTAACALYEPEQLGLAVPTPTGSAQTGQVVIVWGGSTSVGCNAIQLAVASGYEVITTCSPRNYALVKGLGASQAFDYNDSNTINKMVQYLKDKTVAGALSIGYGSALACISILKKSQGRKRLAMISYPGPPSPPTRNAQLQMAWYYVTGKISISIKSSLGSVRSSYVWGGNLACNKLGSAIYNDYLPGALQNGSFKPAPPAEVVGQGLQDIQKAMDKQSEGVSGKKIVVLLS